MFLKGIKIKFKSLVYKIGIKRMSPFLWYGIFPIFTYKLFSLLQLKLQCIYSLFCSYSSEKMDLGVIFCVVAVKAFKTKLNKKQTYKSRFIEESSVSHPRVLRY